ncbi:MAG: hypothetical protein MUF64_21210 [Polyangiaceae bacterium]|jgi:hypothetical protein|nr:hypothetical protein [Polyangiaceae bacterium]
MRRPIPALCVSAVVIVISIQLHRRSATADVRPGAFAPVKPCQEASTALLGGLKPGELLGSFVVSQISCEPSGRIDLGVTRGSIRLLLSVVPPGVLPHEPPKKTRSYHLFYSLRGHQLPPPELEHLLDLLASRIDAPGPRAPTPSPSR